MKSRRKMTIAIVLLAVLSPFVLTALYVDDWSRDLTTNVAWTDPDGADETLRPIEFIASWDEFASALESFEMARPNWTLPNDGVTLPEGSPVRSMTTPPGGGEAEFHLVRTTGFMRYEDDVWLVAESIAAEPDGRLRWRLHAHSQSRVGKGDLGQNPRNLRELLGALRELGSVKSEE